MITDFLLTVILTPVRLLLENIPSFTWPSAISSGVCHTAGGAAVTCKGYEVGGYLGGLNAIVPMGTVFMLIPYVVAAWGVHVGIKAARLVVSMVTGGGGAS